MGVKNEFYVSYVFQDAFVEIRDIDSPDFALILDQMLSLYNEITTSNVNFPPEKICFIFEENCESQKQWDWDFVLNRIYSCLKPVSIFVNDKFYYEILKRNGFNVTRYWPGHLVAPVFSANPRFDLRLDSITNHFCRLSMSRHDHNYIIHKFLTQKDLLQQTIWSYSNCDYHEWYYNFNRFLGIDESEYKMLEEQQQPGSHIGQFMSYESLLPHINSAITINSETVFHGHGPCYSEKLIKCANTARPFIEVSSAHTLKDLHRWGFETFPDLIDESYDDIEDPQWRIEFICREIERLSKIPLAELQDYIKRNRDKLKHNFHVAEKMAQSVFDKNYSGLTL